MLDHLAVHVAELPRRHTVRARQTAAGGSPSLPFEIQAAVFDLGGVLYDNSAWCRWLLHLVHHMGLQTHYTCFFRVWQREFLPQVRAGHRDYWDALRCFLRSAGLSPGQIDEIEAAGHARRPLLEERIRPLPGVAAALSALQRRGVALYVFSSDQPSVAVARRRLVELRLESLFRDVRCRLPSAPAEEAIGMYRELASSIGPHPGQVAYVGNDTCELALARHAGFRSVAIHYDPDAMAHHYVDHFQQLVDVLPWTSPRRVAA